MRSHVVHQSRTSSRKIDLASGSVLQPAEVASFLRPVPNRPIRSLGADRKLPTSKRDQIAIHRLLSSTMAPRGTSATGSSTPAPSDSHPPSNTPDGGDTGGGDRDVASASSPPLPSQSEHSEEEEDEPGQDDLEEEVDDEDGPDDNAPSKDPEDPPAAKPHKTPVTSFLSLEHAATLRSHGDLPSGRAVDSSGQVVAPAVYEVPPEFRQVSASGWLAFLPPSGTTTARRTPRMGMAVWKLSSRWNLSELGTWLDCTIFSVRMMISMIFSWRPA
jgi:hypothetical protein